MKAKIYLIINRYQRSRTADRRPYVTLACERGVHRKFTMLLQRLIRIRCREETRYNMSLLKAIGMTPTGNNFTVATAFIRHIDQNVLAKLTEMVKDEKTSQVLHFGVETTNRAESEHSVLKLWLSTCHVTKGRRKTNSTKRDKSYWEHVSIEHGKIGKSSGSGSGSGSGSSSGSGPSLRGRGRPPRSGRVRDRGRNIGMVVANFLFRDENQWPEIRRKMFYDLHHHMNMYVQLFGSLDGYSKTNWEEGSTPYEHWMDTPGHLYVIDNTSNFCVVLIARLESTNILPLYSNMDCTTGTLFIRFISEQDHFIQLKLRDGCPLPPMQVQWQYHRDV
ncbi:hypothetical protein M9H77_35729 [Catharanthus roseus]|uniref:Uncharacterized protein n=1 Tax=Catharanthus roseus TaxID=4058 RepID=A0ACB9ZRJ7_CATRO|nr:hypothetical protein M9H77_35729 [Catharanthus roseus]